ncbi:MAG TPA: 16S rRNA (adenine(1518)-N(6)/adenine(1519)-N(6))-dimethyltransferase RsmA [Acidobacteriaceae bacterium]|nr:16S rRNA (adenine(1518)-N(6)/adenine(1519)-N(6))-dimethyltransferase RsmA [Acidobacteriaceae bacterium]
MFRKPKLGQNFLVDDSARTAIADALGDVRNRTVLEIGPGHGAITSILTTRCRRLIAIELDPTLVTELQLHFRHAFNVEILHADILKTDLASLVPPTETIDIVGNLPYYITSDILLHLFASARGKADPSRSAISRPLIHHAVIMVQREVADRLAAEPGSRDYGLLSATAQLHARVDKLLTLPPTAFSPPPDVHSTVLRLTFAPRFRELHVDAAGFDTFLKASFAQKRKTLVNNLRAAGYSAETLRTAWPSNIPAQARAESIALEEMAVLYRALIPRAVEAPRLLQ